ncbi:MAG TPA: response regulator [Terriglobales bacterium]|nr:response regulator [Terriglobales bacterium]
MQDRRILNSWKEISQYVGRGVRTLQRYERTLNFPIRRVAGRPHTSVMAFSDEIDRWLDGRSRGTHLNLISAAGCDEWASESASVTASRKLLPSSVDSGQIWLVEDEAGYVQQFQEAVAEIGSFDVEVFSTSSAALDALNQMCTGKRRAPALIVLDYELAGDSGFDVLAQYRAAASFRPIVPLLAWSVLDNVTTRDMSIWMGASAFVPKRLGDRSLKRTLTKILAKSSDLAGASAKERAQPPRQETLA